PRAVRAGQPGAARRTALSVRAREGTLRAELRAEQQAGMAQDPGVRHSQAARVSDPIFGGVPAQEGVRFAAWAPEGKTLELTLIDGAAAGTHPLAASTRGLRETWVRGAAAGDHYTYRLDGEGPFPDPASRFQPEGVHGPSRIVDPG